MGATREEGRGYNDQSLVALVGLSMDLSVEQEGLSPSLPPFPVD